MFVRSELGPERAGAPVRALRLSLNTPVLAHEALPVGPAQAGIALQEGADDGLRLRVAVRSLRGGEIALYEADAPPATDDPERALDGALAFAEGMGFLFDDVIVGSGRTGGRVALRLWRELLGLEPEAEAGEADEAGDPSVPGHGGPGAAPDGVPAAGPWLSKFRRIGGGGADGAPVLLLRWMASL